MFSSKIFIKRGTPEDIRREIKALADSCFDNRAGKAKEMENPMPQMLYYADPRYGCISLGQLDLWDEFKKRKLLPYIGYWHWTDDREPAVTEDLLYAYSLPVL